MIGGTQNIAILNQECGRKPSLCESCMRRSVCPVFAVGAAREATGSCMPLHKNVRAGQTVVDTGDPFEGFYMVKSGFFKSYFIDANGLMQVTGFFFPGEMFGMGGIGSGRHEDIVEALDTGSVCKIPFSMTHGRRGRTHTDSGASGSWDPSTLLALMKVMSEAISRDRRVMFALGKLCVKRRFAGFLQDISRRMERSGYNPDKFRLCMSRNDIANYLCLAVETVSRLFTQFQSQQIIRVVRRDLEITDNDTLRAIANGEDEEEVLFEKAS